MKTAETHRAIVETCVFCPKLCRWACPVADAEGRETVTPWGLMTLVDDVARGRARLDAVTAEVFAHCTGCRRCQHVCKHDNEMPTALMAARAEAVAAGVAPRGWSAWAEALPPQAPSLDALPTGGEAVLLAGRADEARIAASLALLAAAGRVVGRPVAGGRTLRDTGHRFVAAGRPERAPRRGAGGVARDGAKVVICLDAEDAEALRFGEPGGPRALHLVEALAGRLDALRPAVAGDVLYLDACRLGRGLGLVDAPRALLQAVVRGAVHGAVTAGEAGSCCGAGAALPAVDRSAAAAATGAAMASESVTAGDDVPVVIDGHCADHLRAALAPRPVYASWAAGARAGAAGHGERGGAPHGESPGGRVGAAREPGARPPEGGGRARRGGTGPVAEPSPRGDGSERGGRKPDAAQIPPGGRRSEHGEGER
ncbi:MAG: (Fe-S)-binding protein [Myxococcales bacterium]|nr:(Fe-S)-binding protein [Myxococcales bacterium]